MHMSVYVTTQNVEEAERIGETVVRERLAACANIVPEIRSIYWWEGKVEKGTEAIIFLKTREEKIPPLIRRVKELHSYDVPAIMAFQISDGNPDYLRWVDKETSRKK